MHLSYEKCKNPQSVKALKTNNNSYYDCTYNAQLKLNLYVIVVTKIGRGNRHSVKTKT